MAKLNATQKAFRRDMVNELVLRKGVIAHDRNYGVTVVLTPNDKMGGFANISVAYCSPGDKFKRKYGEYIALSRWIDAKTILVPLNGLSLAEKAEYVTQGEFFS